MAAPGSPLTLDLGRPHPLAVVATAGGVAALAAAATRIVVTFDHGIWLVAYLTLVGWLAPALLSAGERRALAQQRAEDRLARLVAILWLAGVVAVPAGVLGQTRILVCLGAVCLIAALLALVDRTFRSGTEPAPRRTRAALVAHALTIAAMAVSTGIGVGLAWDYPWL